MNEEQNLPSFYSHLARLDIIGKSFLSMEAAETIPCPLFVNCRREILVSAILICCVILAKRTLRIVTIMGKFISVAAFIYVLHSFQNSHLRRRCTGIPNLDNNHLVLGGVQLLSFGIIGEYLGKVFYETKKRPVYVAWLVRKGMIGFCLSSET